MISSARANPAKRLGLRDFDIRFDVYQQTARVIVGGTERAALDYCAWFFDDPAYATTHPTVGRIGFMIWRDCYGSVLWLKQRPRTPLGISVLCHEMLHAAVELLCYKGVKIATDDHEALAYLLDCGVRQVLEELQ